MIKKSIDNATNYYERVKISQDPKIKETINNNEKISKALQEIITLIENDKLRHGGDFIKKATKLDWIFNKDLYENANNDVYTHYQKDKDSFELLSLQTFVSNINRGYTKIRKDAWEEFKTVKGNVKSEVLKEIIKELEFGLFGTGDDGDDGDDKDKRDDGNDKDKRDDGDDGDDGSIGERVKLKNQNKKIIESIKDADKILFNKTYYDTNKNVDIISST